MKVVLYARFSPRPEGETCESNETQLAYCRRWCEENGHTIIAEFTDSNMSGDNADRPGLWKAIESSKKGMIVVYRRDRLVRSTYLSEVIYRELAKQNTELHCVNSMNVDDSPDGKLIRTILSAFDQHQKDISALRTKWAMLNHQSSGWLMSRHPPFGMQVGESAITTGRNGLTRERKRIIPCPEEQEAIDEVKRLKSDGGTLGSIAEAMNDSGKLYRGKPWNRKQVQRILLSLKRKRSGSRDAKVA
jgi:DNA invertase Pin-like site-specific DNA recombinase